MSCDHGSMSCDCDGMSCDCIFVCLQGTRSKSRMSSVRRGNADKKVKGGQSNWLL